MAFVFIVIAIIVTVSFFVLYNSDLQKERRKINSILSNICDPGVSVNILPTDKNSVLSREDLNKVRDTSQTNKIIPLFAYEHAHHDCYFSDMVCLCDNKKIIVVNSDGGFYLPNWDGFVEICLFCGRNPSLYQKYFNPI